MKKLLIFLGILLVAPFIAGAAYNDVTMTTDVVINVGGIDLNVSGSNAVIESITVNASNFSFVLLSGSSISVTSAGGRLLSTDASGAYIVSSACSGSSYILKHSSSATDSVTVTITPQSTSCPSTSSEVTGSASGSSRGGSGGVASVPVTPVATIPVSVPVVAAVQQSFTRLLSVGSTGDDVKNLQIRLLGEGFFKGEATGYFGPLTQAAVKAYQAKYGIDQLGIVGPATRAQLNKLVIANAGSNAAATSQLTPAQISTITAQISALLQQVQLLQAKLKALSN